MSQTIRWALILAVYFGLLFAVALCGRAQGADVCSSNTLAEVSSNRQVVGVFMGDAARSLIKKLGNREVRDWANTRVKVVAGKNPDYVHILIIENNCVVSIMSRPLETYKAARTN